MYSLIEMLKYKRPEGSVTQREFCKRFLEPVFGLPDAHGNYILHLGDKPRIAFMAHHDTVHSKGGLQKLVVTEETVSTMSDCLGADCTTGIYIMLNMIEAGINGVYIVHAAEEVGCVGSSRLVADNPLWLSEVDIAISFDRWGTKSVITHQLGERTCSDDFALSLALELRMEHEPDTKGSYTDSNEYRGVIAECTNLSVGYYHQHSAKEYQDLVYLEEFIANLLQVNWDALPVCRTPVKEYDDSWMTRWNDFDYGRDDLYQFVRDNPQKICDFLESYGIDYNTLMEEFYTSGYNYGAH